MLIGSNHCEKCRSGLSQSERGVKGLRTGGRGLKNLRTRAVTDLGKGLFLLGGEVSTSLHAIITYMP